MTLAFSGLNVNLAAAAHALGGEVSNGQVLCPGPGHSRRDRSLATRFFGDDFVVHSFAGDDPIVCRDYVRERLRLRTWEPSRAGVERGGQRPTSSNCKSDAESNFRRAMLIWQDCRPATGTGVQRYLRNRGIDIVIPPTIRFHPRLKYAKGDFWPAIVAIVTDVNDKPIGIHRTFLEPDTWIKAPVERPKMMLGHSGGGSVRLRTLGDRIAVSEGIETGLTALYADGRPVWAALSACGIKSLELPPNIREIVVLADPGVAGESAARAASRRWLKEGRRAGWVLPASGADFNDLLREAC
jgi:putative DNA primase/helicase